jgi:hypothetical protein
LPGIFWCGEDELLNLCDTKKEGMSIFFFFFFLELECSNLFKLMNAEYTPGILPMGTGFFAIAGTVTSVSARHVRLYIKPQALQTLRERYSLDR